MIRKVVILYNLRSQNQGQLDVFGAHCQEKHSNNYRCSVHKMYCLTKLCVSLTLTLPVQTGHSLVEDVEEGTRGSCL